MPFFAAHGEHGSSHTHEGGPAANNNNATLVTHEEDMTWPLDVSRETLIFILAALCAVALLVLMLLVVALAVYRSKNRMLRKEKEILEDDASVDEEKPRTPWGWPAQPMYG